MASPPIAASLVRLSTTPLNPRRKNGRAPPITISTSPSHVDVLHLRELLHAAGHSCYRLPSTGSDGRPKLVALEKLQRAVEHSPVVVSVFCKRDFLIGDQGLEEDPGFTGFEQMFERVVSVPCPSSKLVGFGRAVSDGALTASIHDVVVMPSLQRLGIGRKIVQRLVRILTSKDIYDISALCSAEERLFFAACGFGDDILGSTTMMYTRQAVIGPDDEQ
ncbi:acyl-CoA N-acyltransferases (NAT) superfamily protein [Wolffia australiana]